MEKANEFVFAIFFFSQSIDHKAGARQSISGFFYLNNSETRKNVMEYGY